MGIINLEYLLQRIESNLNSNSLHSQSMLELPEAIYIMQHWSTIDLIQASSMIRYHFFKNYVMIHILNNVQNGICTEDCCYCAQSVLGSVVPKYFMKKEEEILQEAEEAKSKGAYRYCLVTSGRSLTLNQAKKYASIIKKIINRHQLQVCLSAGLITDSQVANILACAGLNRYNHNLNTSRRFFPEITTTHTFEDRLKTLQIMADANIELCSGVIVGMGERINDILEVAFTLNQLAVKSIPVNFFVPVPGSFVNVDRFLSADECLRILAIFRLINPAAEIRMAAGRELYLKNQQIEALKIANSLFIDGYLNVKGTSTYQTLKMILTNGFELDPKSEIGYSYLTELLNDNNQWIAENDQKLYLKSLSELRPHEKANISKA